MSDTSATDQLYVQHAPRWHQRVSKLGYPAAYAHLMAQLPPLREGATVLDIGTGSAAFADAFAAQAPRSCRITLADPHQEMLDQARQTARPWRQEVHLTQASLGDPLGEFDVILCAHVLEHLDIRPALDWLFNSLRPGGTLVLALSRPHWCTALIRWRWGHRAYTPAQVQALLADAGFSDIAPHPFPAGPPYRTSHGYIARRP